MIYTVIENIYSDIYSDSGDIYSDRYSDSDCKYHVIEKWLTGKLASKRAKGNEVIYRSVASKFFAVCLIFLYIQVACFLVINKNQ